jgi:hypothetical protein
MAACQSSREVKIRLARLMLARLSIIRTSASDTLGIMPIAILEYLSVRATSILDMGLFMTGVSTQIPWVDQT